MAADSEDATRHAGQVVRRMLLRRNIAVDAETAQLVAAAVQAALQADAPTGRRAGVRVFPPPTASRCSDIAPAIRLGACSCQIPGTGPRRGGGIRAGGIPAIMGSVAR
jgi:hypothetical protein